MKLITPLLALLCSLPATHAADPAPFWEGLVTLKLTLPGAGYQYVNYSTHKGKVRVDLLGGDYGSRIIDLEKKEVINIAPGGKTYTRQPFAPAPAAVPGVQVEKAATSAPINGHPTSHYTVKIGETRADVWLADDTTAEFWRLSDAPWAVALAGKNGLPLRAAISTNGKIIRMEPETVRLMRQSDEDFAPPPDAKEVAPAPAAPAPASSPSKVDDEPAAPASSPARSPAPSNGRRR